MDMYIYGCICKYLYIYIYIYIYPYIYINTYTYKACLVATIMDQLPFGSNHSGSYRFVGGPQAVNEVVL